MGLSAYCVNKIYSRTRIEQAGIRFDETSSFSEDVKFNVRYCQVCSGIVSVNRMLYRYYYFPSSLNNIHRSDKTELHLVPFAVRLPLITEDEMGEYCDIWLWRFLRMLEADMNADDGLSAAQKLRKGSHLFHTEEMRFCIDHASGKNDSPLFMKVLRTHSYYLYRLFQMLVKIKNRGN